MTRFEKLVAKILRGSADANIRFTDLVGLLEQLGFDVRIKGDHHICSRPELDEILNLQPRGAHAKPYQVKQVRTLLTKYQLLIAPPDKGGPDDA